MKLCPNTAVADPGIDWYWKHLLETGNNVELTASPPRAPLGRETNL
jgi:hypothetical protein